MALERIVGGVMETESRLTWIEELVKGEKNIDKSWKIFAVYEKEKERKAAS